MAIQFARAQYIGRSNGQNACRKGAYNARTQITDEKTNVTYDFSNRQDNVYHLILIPDYVNQKFKDPSELANAIEHIERKKNSQLIKEYVLALPDEKNVSLEMKIEMVHEFIERNKWIEEGLAVQVDIHEPHEEEKNWHAHLGVTTRRFTEDGKRLGEKARDLDPKVRGGGNGAYIKSNEELNIGKLWADVQNDIFRNHGLENRVDSIGINVQEHIGPVRMRSIMNAAVERNEERRVAEIEYLDSGERLLQKVTNHMSVFTKDDLYRAVKYISDQETRDRLVEDALSEKSIISLFTGDSKETKYYTTQEVRLEEEKIMRLSGYVAKFENVIDASLVDMGSAGNSLTLEQNVALQEILFSKSGLRILRGRAGTGKSKVLGKLPAVCNNIGINVIGIAPTHKAKIELTKHGYEQVDTIKGMLFKLADGRFALPKNSLIVVDEAGMVSNSDYHELLRVAATRKCNIILAGDERQLSSVTRGGMFEAFSDHYGSSVVLNIQRQDSSWGKEVAQSFASGDVRNGIATLESHGRIKRANEAASSMQDLIRDWHKSEHNINDRLILAVRNKDVIAINHGVRQYLKKDGHLTGVEFDVGGNHYMQGDRILIVATNKKLGVTNGDIAEIIHASQDKFTIKILSCSDKEISFNPSDYNGFRHGYATTVFKSQGASILDVYVYHDGFSSLRNSYVALSRHIRELNLYVNQVYTSDNATLIRQLSRELEHGNSLGYSIFGDQKTPQHNEQEVSKAGIFSNVMVKSYKFFTENITKLTDQYIPKSEYYNYRAPKQEIESVKEVIDRMYEENQNRDQRIVVGDDINHANENHVTSENHVTADSGTVATKSGISAKERFYRNAEFVRNKYLRQSELKAAWDNDTEILRKEASFKAASIATDLLGPPNKRLSNGKELRFGENGKIVVCISGGQSGIWYDFSTEKGGDMFDFVQEIRGNNFKGAADYLRYSLGITTGLDIHNSHLRLVHDMRARDIAEKYIKDTESKIKYAQKLYDGSKPLSSNSVADRYLREKRGINVDVIEDLKTTSIYDKEAKLYIPALISYARDKNGCITGGQYVLLDKHSGCKADVAVPKRSFGKISGSFVDLGNLSNTRNINESPEERITIIAEGLETALSVKQALRLEDNGMNSKILCSLGISNISNYEPKKDERIIIAADNDGEHSVTNKTIDNARIALEEKGAFVEIVKPAKEGDFNDMLHDSLAGEKGICESFREGLSRHRAGTLMEYFATENGRIKLSAEEISDINYLARFKLNEEQILNIYKRDAAQGKVELEKIVKSVVFTDKCVRDNMRVIDSANVFGANINKRELVKSMIGKSREEIGKHIIDVREKHYFSFSLDVLSEDRKHAKTPEQSLKALKAEQDFLAKLNDNYAPNIHSDQLIKNISIAHNNEKHNVFSKLEKLALHLETTEIKKGHIQSIIKNATNSAGALNSLTKKYHSYVMSNIASALKDINAGTTIFSGTKSFNCKVKLIEHILDQHQHNEFFPKDNIEKLYHDLTKNNQLSHSFNERTM